MTKQKIQKNVFGHIFLLIKNDHMGHYWSLDQDLLFASLL